MGPLNVAIAWPMSETLVQRVASVSPRLHVENIADRVRREIQLIRSDPQGSERKQVTAELDRIFKDTEVLLSAFRLPDRVPDRAPNLKWIQVAGAGLDRLIVDARGKENIIVTNARGAAATPIAEWVLGVMIMFAKRMPECYEARAKRHFAFNELPTSNIAGKTVGILGLGAIGNEVARLSKLMGTNVLATRRSSTKRETSAGPVDELLPPSQMLDIFQRSDFVVATLPLTPETTHIVAEKELRAMKPTAYLLNVGRGALIDEAVLVKALKEHWIAGAGLDVFEKEPLPPESELWTLPNVIMTPHNSGQTDDYVERVLRIFNESLKRYLAGQPPLNIVDKSRGY